MNEEIEALRNQLEDYYTDPVKMAYIVGHIRALRKLVSSIESAD